MSDYSKPFVEVKLKLGSTTRKPTPKELAKSLEIRKKLIALRAMRAEIDKMIKDVISTCDHTVSIDEAGWTYDSRECHGCGKDQGLI